MERAINEVADQLLASRDKPALVKVLTEIIELIEKNVYNRARMELMDELREAVLEEVAMNGGNYEVSETKSADRKHTALFGQRDGFETHTSFTTSLNENYDDDGAEKGTEIGGDDEILDEYFGNKKWELNLKEDRKPLTSHLGQVNASTATLDIDDDATVEGDSEDERDAMFDAAFNARFSGTPMRVPKSQTNDDEVMERLMQNPLFARVSKNLDNLKAGKPMYSPAELVAIRGKDFGELDSSVAAKFSQLQVDNMGDDADAYLDTKDMRAPQDNVENLD